MKKIIMAVAIVCAAAIANAASLSWSLTGITASESTAVAAGSMVAYLMDGATYSAFSAADNKGAYVAANSLQSALIAVGRTGATASGTYGTYAPGDSISAYIVLFDGTDATKAANYASTTAQTITVPGAGNAKLTTTFAGTSGWQPAGDVPEPTSGMLVLIGMAGLALRRRRRA